MLAQLMPALRATLVLSILTGLIFPLLVTAIAQVLFPDEANGSLVHGYGKRILGSKLIAQPFTKHEYFHPRPSAAGSGYSGESSGGTNLGPTSKKLFDGQKADPTKKVDAFLGVSQLLEQYRKENGLAPHAKVPVDAVTRSGSGLDPHISVANAMLQASRVAKVRNMKEHDVLEFVHKYTEERQLGLLGEPRVNVLLLNQAMDDAL
jgi:K+-transporting ATPase ATPase C chain